MCTTAIYWPFFAGLDNPGEPASEI